MTCTCFWKKSVFADTLRITIIWVNKNNLKRKPEKLKFPVVVWDTIETITRILNWRIHQENLHHT